MKNYAYRIFFLSAVLCGGLLGLLGSLGSLKSSPLLSSLSSSASTNIASELSALVPRTLSHAVAQVDPALPLGLSSGANAISPTGVQSIRTELSALSSPYNTLKETVTLAEHNESSCCSWWNSVGKIIVLIFAIIAYSAGGWYLITRKHNN